MESLLIPNTVVNDDQSDALFIPLFVERGVELVAFKNTTEEG